MYQVLSDSVCALIDEYENTVTITLNCWVNPALVARDAAFYHIPLEECRSFKDRKIFRIKTLKDHLARVEEIIKNYVA